MVRTAAEIFYNKVSLIYEYNKKSPLFVRKAGQELENNNTDKAVEILLAGIKIFPNYAAAHILLSKAYTLKGNLSDAAKALKTGCDIIRSPQTYDYYMQEINRSQGSLFQFGNLRSFNEEEKKAEQPDLFGDIISEISVAPEKHEEPVSTNHERPYGDIENRLDEIAKGLSGVKLNQVEPTNKDYSGNTFSEDKVIVSETLAKIYAAQGEIKEAIQVYKKLIKKYPHKESYYNEKINELSLQLE